MMSTLFTTLDVSNDDNNTNLQPVYLILQTIMPSLTTLSQQCVKHTDVIEVSR